jgi:TRAP-type C4-dicarboxylate transport system substrate-binding protein
MSKKLTWVIAHEPYHLFINAASQFAEEIYAETNGAYQIEVLGLNEWAARKNIDISVHFKDRERVVKLVDEGVIDIATTYIETLGRIEKDLYVLGMPYLFNDDDHATEILDGAIGDGLLERLGNKSNLQGLAFTYSGGFRIMPGTKALESLEDFYNMPVACSHSPVSYDIFKATGATPKPMAIDAVKQAITSGDVQAGSTTYARFFASGYNDVAEVINDTQHSLFLTSMVTNKQLWDSMTPKTRAIFKNAALRAAKLERQESVADNTRVQLEAAAAGIETVSMTSKEKSKLVRATRSIYDKYYTYFSPGLLSSIER